MPKRRRIALSSFFRVLPDVGAEQTDVPAGRTLQSDDLAHQHGLTGAAAADQGVERATLQRETDSIVHRLLTEARDDRINFEDRRQAVLHTPISWKNTANAASSRITATMLCTTVDVVAMPTARVSRATDIPMRQPITAITSANTGALANPTSG